MRVYSTTATAMPCLSSDSIRRTNMKIKRIYQITGRFCLTIFIIGILTLSAITLATMLYAVSLGIPLFSY